MTSYIFFDSPVIILYHGQKNVKRIHETGQGCCKIVLAACSGSQKEKKRFLRGHITPWQRARRPLRSRCTPFFPILQQPWDSEWENLTEADFKAILFVKPVTQTTARLFLCPSIAEKQGQHMQEQLPVLRSSSWIMLILSRRSWQHTFRCPVVQFSLESGINMEVRV